MNTNDYEGGGQPSRARDHLANERTSLAWLRTAANMMVVGVAIAQFAKAGGATAIAAGAVLALVGAAGLVYGTLRYRRVNPARSSMVSTSPEAAAEVLPSRARSCSSPSWPRWGC